MPAAICQEVDRRSVYTHDLDGVFFRQRKGKYCVFTFNMDDSADANRQKVVVVAGFVGDSSEWFDVERHWEERIHLEGLEYFRTTEFRMSLKRKYGPQEGRERADGLLLDLKLIVKASNLEAFGLGVLMQDYIAVREEITDSVLESDPYIHAHEHLIYQVAEAACAHPQKHGVAFIYDQHDKAKFLQAQWDEFKARNPLVSECMTTLAPMDDKTTPAIQVADLMAHTTKLYFEDRIDKELPLVTFNSEKDMGPLQEWAKRLKSLIFWDKKFLRLMIQYNPKKA